MKIVRFDSVGGASGDMILGALIGLGADCGAVAQELDRLLAEHSVTVRWVKGHADNEFNNRCDALAVRRRDEYAHGG